MPKSSFSALRRALTVYGIIVGGLFLIGLTNTYAVQARKIRILVRGIDLGAAPVVAQLPPKRHSSSVTDALA